METNIITAGRILLNIHMIADDLEDMQWDFKLYPGNRKTRFSGISLYYGQTELQSDRIYILEKGNSGDFPSDRYSYITSDDIHGNSPHISCIKHDDASIINAITSVFEKYHDFESKINRILFSDGSLDDLCREAGLFFKNPMYIHDKYFTIIALPSHPKGMLDFEKSNENGSLHVPLWLINDFKYDEAYQDTFNNRNAAIWGTDQYPKTMRSLYVNLYDGSYYLGRLLINELESAIRPGQFELAETLAEYIKIIIQRNQFSKDRKYRDYEDTIRTIIRNDKINSSDLRDFLEIQGWQQEDTYVCAKLQSQNPDILIKSDSALRGKLSSIITESFDFFHEQRLCLIINITRSNASINSSSIKTILAEPVRESLMYCGISNPIKGILNIGDAFKQADYSLLYIKNDSSHWLVSFGECALSFMINDLAKEIDITHFAAPELAALKAIDESKGTDYYKTLKVYLQNERDIPKTSEELIIHRTTLQYRLNKIKEITKLDLDKEKLRLYLILSCMILDEFN